MPSNAGTQFYEECPPAQPVGDFWTLPAVRTGRSCVWVSWPPGQLIPDTFSFPPCTAQKVNCPAGAREAPLEGFLFGVSKRKWGVHSDGQSPSSGGKAAHRYMPTVTALRFPALSGRRSCRFLESGPRHPPLAALGPLEHRRTSRFPAALRPPTGVLPRKRAASSAAGGAWPA